MTHQLFRLPREVLISGAQVKPGWKVSFFLTITSTPTPVYTTSARNVSHTQPVEADAGGLMPEIYLDPAITYKVEVRDQFDVLVYTADPVNDRTGVDSGDIEYDTTAAETSAGVTPTNAAYPPGHAWRYGADPTGSVSATSALTNAVAANNSGQVYIPSGTYLLSTQWAIPDAAKVKIVGDGFGSRINKGFSGNAISLGKRSSINSLYLDGAGATYTGGGVIISTGAPSDPPSARYIDKCFILNTKSAGVEFSGAQGGYGSKITSCQILPYDLTTPAIKFPNDASGTGNRLVSDTWTGSNEIADLGSSENTQILGCTGAGPLFSGSVEKVVITGCRLTTSHLGNWTVKGTHTTVTGNIISVTAIVLDSSLVQAAWSGNGITPGTTITDNATGAGSSSANQIYLDIDVTNSTSIPTWASAGTQPALVNGSLTGVRKRNGTTCKFSLILTAGSSTTFGTGAWTFAIPYLANRSATGSAMFFDSSTGFVYTGVAYIAAGATVMRVTPATSTAFADATTPFAWASGDFVTADIEFIIN